MQTASRRSVDALQLTEGAGEIVLKYDKKGYPTYT